MPSFWVIGLVVALLLAKGSKGRGPSVVDARPYSLAKGPSGFPAPVLAVGDFVKLVFLSAGDTEHMWVQVTALGDNESPFIGVLDDAPLLPSLRRVLRTGQTVPFFPENVEVRVRAGDAMDGARHGLKLG